ncbi:MAG: DMT family transporter [Gammaproteobacteria bacterium]
MAWLLLFVAGLFETAWAIGLKYTNGFTRFWPSLGTGTALVASMWLLAVALKTLPIGIAYAVWVGIGAVGTFVLGAVLLGEPVNGMRITGILLIVGGIVVLRLA